MALKKIAVLLVLSFGLAADLTGGRELAVTQVAPSARALALGNAYAAHKPDAASFLWNPGALAFNEKKEVATIQTKLATEVDFFGLSGIWPLDWCNLGVYWAQLQIADMPETAASLNNNEVEILSKLTYYENTAVLAAARKIFDSLGLGVSLRQTSQRISSDYGYGSGWAGAAGLYYQWNRLTLGLAANNINAYQQYDTGYLEHLPQTYTAGIGLQILDNLAVYYDRQQIEKTERNYAGLEIFLTPRINLAVGYMDDRFTAGAGLTLEHVYFDYAYAAQNKSTLGSDQYISLGVRW